jgi:signal transduction histidine kinase
MSSPFKPRVSSNERRRSPRMGRTLFGDVSDEDRLQRALRDERLRLSRELHDGALQSLTGAALQLEALAVGMGEAFPGIRKRMREIQQMLLEEERELRAWIESMKHPLSTSTVTGAEPAAHIARLCRRIERQWGLPIRLTVSGGHVAAASGMADQIYRLVQESLVNIVKHAYASVAQVERSLLADRVRIVVRDNGRGFPFLGRFNLAALNARGWGPVSIKERIASMNGELVVTSASSGSCLEMELPLRLQSLSSESRTVRRRSR